MEILIIISINVNDKHKKCKLTINKLAFNGFVKASKASKSQFNIYCDLMPSVFSRLIPLLVMRMPLRPAPFFA